MTPNRHLKYLVTGVSGQDGFFSARHFLKKGHKVIGISRTGPSQSPQIRLLQTYPGFLHLHWKAYTKSEVDSVFSDLKPDRVIHAAGQRDIPVNEEEVQACFHTNCELLEMLLKSLCDKASQTRLIFLSSAEIFGRSQRSASLENSERAPHNPYGISKLQGMEIVSHFRKLKNTFACTAICFNHDSFLSPPGHLVRLIPHKLLRWKMSKSDVRPTFFNTEMQRDWSHAKDFVRAFDLILEGPTPEDYVVGSGTAPTLQQYINLCCGLLKINAEDMLIQRLDEPTYDRIADPTKLKTTLGWRPQVDLTDIAREMIWWEKRRLR